MLTVPLNKSQIKKAKQAVKYFDEKIEIWKTVKDRATKELENSPNKYYANIKFRITYAQKQIDKFEQKKEEFKEAIKERKIFI